MSFLCLPLPAQQIVIRNLDHIDHVSLSLCSKRAKSVVKTAELNLTEHAINFANRLEVELDFGTRCNLKITFMGKQNARSFEWSEELTDQCDPNFG